MGAPVTFGIDFRFDAARADRGVHVLDEFLYAWTARFEFRDVATGRTYERGRMERCGGGPPWTHLTDRVELEGGAIPAIPVLVRLLGEGGAQIPAGTYAVTALYANDGEEHGAEGHDAPLPPRSTLWVGDLRSGDLRLEVSTAELQDFETEWPRSIHVWLDRAKGYLEWDYRDDSWTEIRVSVSPGYDVVTCVDAGYSRIESGQRGPRTSSSRAILRLATSRDRLKGPYRVHSPSVADEPVEVEVIIQALETSHRCWTWESRGADDRVLVADTLRATWP
ncbi:MAG: hypothetical protein U0167_03140 [bacterium]